MAVSGFLEIGKVDAIKRVVLNGASTLARATAKALRALLKFGHVAVILGDTYATHKASDNKDSVIKAGTKSDSGSDFMVKTLLRQSLLSDSGVGAVNSA
jgi:hypothetical protein